MYVIEDMDILFDEEEITRKYRLGRLIETNGPLSKYIDEAKTMIQPKAVYTLLRIAGIDGDKVMLENGYALRSQLLAEKLQKTPEVALYIVTIGDQLEKRVSKLSREDMLHSLVFDYLGTYAVGMLRRHIQSLVEGRMKVKVSHFGPGETETWDMEQQTVIFDMLMSSDEVKSKVNMEITESSLLVPKKSNSGLLAQTEGVYIQCNFCRLKCEYRRAKYLGATSEASSYGKHP